ncbi:cytochrome c [Aliiruegeria haliotis]|uniref:Cytochrome c n=1 Tax=Aliiruegeria haliotis TaxID=1280846 RepID=A0A2T0RMZ7_9RHOB|nr:c-type cytochrome [Aliiruegeria haliotis]PRY22507.1 cytochrome c [Aliiruegeria haliotis]
MPRHLFVMLAAATLCGGAAAAQDAEAGATAFARQCATCHRVVAEDGTLLAGRAGRIGPNLYGIPGAVAAADAGFRYGSSLLDAAGSGLVWEEEALVRYLLDPDETLREITGNPKARSRMAWRVKAKQDARNIVAFLASLK